MKKEKIICPTSCPHCDSLLERIKDQLFCRNSGCEAKTSKLITHFAKTMQIKGLGEKTIEKLGLDDVFDIYQLDKHLTEEVIGEKLSTKLFSEVIKSQTSSIDKFLAAFSIPLVGKTIAKKISTKTNEPHNITKEMCKALGIGDKATHNLLYWIQNSYSNKYFKLPIRLEDSVIVDNDVLVCISGKLKSFKTKAIAEKYLNDNNITVTSSISKKVDYLISEDDKESTKVNKAQEYNIPVVTINELIEEINK